LVVVAAVWGGGTEENERKDEDGRGERKRIHKKINKAREAGGERE